MRISDGSSDVGSSDLGLPESGQSLPELRCERRVRQPVSFDRPPRLDRPGSHKRVQSLASRFDEVASKLLDEHLVAGMAAAHKACLEAHRTIEDAYTPYLDPSHRHFTDPQIRRASGREK